jgi:hypothetical protein
VSDDPVPARRPALRERLSTTFLKPAPEHTSDVIEVGSPDELRSAVKSLDDKERLIGLIAAPWAAGIGVIVGTTLIDRDPAAYLASGAANPLHVSITLYHEVLGVLVVLSIAMLAMALLRKRLFLGIVLALYGLTIFNLHYWGFGVPFLLCGAWYLVRASRLQRRLKEATGESTRGGRDVSRGSPRPARPASNKRYTPKPAPRRF